VRGKTEPERTGRHSGKKKGGSEASGVSPQLKAEPDHTGYKKKKKGSHKTEPKGKRGTGKPSLAGGGEDCTGHTGEGHTMKNITQV